LFHNLALGCVGEYYRVVHALAQFSPALTFFNTTSVFTTLHLESDGFFSLFLEDYKPDQDLELFFDSFKLTLQRMPHLSTNGPFGMVLNTFKTIFTLKIQVDSLNCFNIIFILHKATFHPKLQMSLKWPTS
jgi:hypothetical protein